MGILTLIQHLFSIDRDNSDEKSTLMSSCYLGQTDAASMRKTSLATSVGAVLWCYPGTEKENVKLTSRLRFLY